MEATIVCEDQNYTGRVFSTMYLDWGFEVMRNGQRIFYNPHFLSHESYGFDWEDEDGKQLEEGSEWTSNDWEMAIMDLLEDMAPGFEETVAWETGE